MKKKEPKEVFAFSLDPELMRRFKACKPEYLSCSMIVNEFIRFCVEENRVDDLTINKFIKRCIDAEKFESARVNQSDGLKTGG